MDELSLFSRISKFCFYLGCGVSLLYLTYSMVIPGGSALAVVGYFLLVFFTVLTQAGGIYLYFREPHVEHLWLKGATLKAKVKTYLTSVKPYLFFALGLLTILGLWVFFSAFNGAIRSVWGEVPVLIRLSGLEIPWTILLGVPLYFVFDRSDMFFKRFGDITR